MVFLIPNIVFAKGVDHITKSQQTFIDLDPLGKTVSFSTSTLHTLATRKINEVKLTLERSTSESFVRGIRACTYFAANTVNKILGIAAMNAFKVRVVDTHQEFAQCEC